MGSYLMSETQEYTHLTIKKTIYDSTLLSIYKSIDDKIDCTICNLNKIPIKNIMGDIIFDILKG